MAIIFDGKKFASDKLEKLSKKVTTLKKKGISPKLETILTTDMAASELYVSMKKKAGESIGIGVDVFPIALQKRNKRNLILEIIKRLNNDDSVHGILVQLPLVKNLKDNEHEILNKIAPEKDVDGQRDDSKFLPATVSGVIQIIELAKKETKQRSKNVLVVGDLGVVGKSLVKELKNLKYEVTGCDKNGSKTPLAEKTKNADILVSCTGVTGLINGSIVKPGAIVIDVGSPKGDIVYSEVSKVASFVTPVPGGVGPVTIACLLENLVQACYNTVS